MLFNIKKPINLRQIIIKQKSRYILQPISFTVRRLTNPPFLPPLQPDIPTSSLVMDENPGWYQNDFLEEEMLKM